MENISRIFEELTESAREYPLGLCGMRAAIIKGAIKNSYPSSDPRTLKIEHRFGYANGTSLLRVGLTLRPRLYKQVRWDRHEVIEWNGQVYDPALGTPVPTENYLRTMFRNPSFMLKVKQI